MSFFGRIRKAVGRVFSGPPPETTPSPPERDRDYPVGTGYDPETDRDWRILRWTGPGGLSDWREAGVHRITQRQIIEADKLVIEVTDSNGATKIRTFTGPTGDVNRTIQYWLAIDSI